MKTISRAIILLGVAATLGGLNVGCTDTSVSQTVPASPSPQVTATPTPTTPATTPDFYSQGLAKMQQGDYQGAIADFNQAIQLNPSSADAYYNRGFAQAQAGNYQAALTDFNQAIQLNPNYAEAYYSRGVALSRLGDEQGAIADYRQAAELYRQQGRDTDYQTALKAVDSIQALQILW